MVMLLMTASMEVQSAHYLFVYFEGKGEPEQQEHLRYALSDDGIHWHALNQNRPVVLSDTVCLTHGLRDPHILRTEDGNTFLLVATDMKATRDGWTTNPGMVFMRSDDLIHWSHSTVQLDRLFPEHFSHVRYTWAPQTIYDRKAGRYMVYFTVIFQGESQPQQGLASMNKGSDMVTYYAYLNDDFTSLATEPQVLFAPQWGCIDNDIIEAEDGTYHMFYKGSTHDAEGKEIQSGIMHNTSSSLTGPWPEATSFVDYYSDKNIGVEGSCVFRRAETGDYVLMYDLFGAGRFEFQTSPDLHTFSARPESFAKDFSPRHGYVIQITAEEAARLESAYGSSCGIDTTFTATANPFCQHKHLADPASLVVGDTLFIYAGHDECPERWQTYVMNEWCILSTSDLVHWQEHHYHLRSTDFPWAKDGAWASQVVERGGRYYWFVTANHKTIPGMAIGVAVADHPAGPFTPMPEALITNDMTTQYTDITWEDIDPTVFVDDDGKAYIFWGNTQLWMARLKPNMVELDGKPEPVSIDGVDMPSLPQPGKSHYTEAPWIHKLGDWYYLSFSIEFPEKTAYAMSHTIHGPWQYKGVLNELAGNCNTNHHAIFKWKGGWYFLYHNGGDWHTQRCQSPPFNMSR